MKTNLLFREVDSKNIVVSVTDTEVSSSGVIDVRVVRRFGIATIEARYYDIDRLGLIEVVGEVEGDLRLIGDFKRNPAVQVSGTLTHSFD